MPRAPKAPGHGWEAPPAFLGSTRRKRLPRDWEARRRRVRARAGERCEWMEDGRRCPRLGSQCDHIKPGDDHSLSNLQWLCTEHHRRKTGREGHAASVARKGLTGRLPEGE